MNGAAMLISYLQRETCLRAIRADVEERPCSVSGDVSSPDGLIHCSRQRQECNAVPADAAARPASHGLSPHAFNSSCIRLHEKMRKVS